MNDKEHLKKEIWCYFELARQSPLRFVVLLTTDLCWYAYDSPYGGSEDKCLDIINHKLPSGCE